VAHADSLPVTEPTVSKHSKKYTTRKTLKILTNLVDYYFLPTMRPVQRVNNEHPQEFHNRIPFPMGMAKEEFELNLSK